MIDFTGLPTRHKFYAGANGSKISVIYQGQQYMLKFPAPARQNKEMGYSNSCISEYLGCHIFNSIGLQAQDTLLGVYGGEGREERVVVACKDFTSPGIVLQDFASLKNTMIDSERNGYGTELSDILFTIQSQRAMRPAALHRHFWDMFIVDAFIGNWDRHNGNWGFLYDTVHDTISLAPIFDCGSCLYAQADDATMRAVLSSQAERNARIYNRPLSGIELNGKKINYYDFISGMRNKDCSAALLRIVPRIDMEQIGEIVESTPFISLLQKDFYRTMLQFRKEVILDRTYECLQEKLSLARQNSYPLIDEYEAEPEL